MIIAILITFPVAFVLGYIIGYNFGRNHHLAELEFERREIAKHRTSTTWEPKT